MLDLEGRTRKSESRIYGSFDYLPEIGGSGKALHMSR